MKKLNNNAFDVIRPASNFKPLVGLFLVCILFMSCGPNTNSSTGSAPNPNTVFLFQKLDKSVILQYYNEPNFSKFVFQFLTSDLSSATDKIGLYAWAIATDGTPLGTFLLRNAGKDTTLNGPLILGNLEWPKDAVKTMLFDSTGQIITFDDVLFTPTIANSVQVSYNLFAEPATATPAEHQKLRLGSGQGGLNPSPPAPPGIVDELKKWAGQ